MIIIHAYTKYLYPTHHAMHKRRVSMNVFKIKLSEKVGLGVALNPPITTPIGYKEYPWDDYS